MISGLSLRNLSVRRGGRLLFENLGLELRSGEACALTGPNGSGKTSLLRAVAGLVRAEAGEIVFDGADPEAARGAGLHFIGHQDGDSAQQAGLARSVRAGQRTGPTGLELQAQVLEQQSSAAADAEISQGEAGDHFCLPR